MADGSSLLDLLREKANVSNQNCQEFQSDIMAIFTQICSIQDSSYEMWNDDVEALFRDQQQKINQIETTYDNKCQHAIQSLNIAINHHVSRMDLKNESHEPSKSTSDDFNVDQSRNTQIHSPHNLKHDPLEIESKSACSEIDYIPPEHCQVNTHSDSKGMKRKSNGIHESSDNAVRPLKRQRVMNQSNMSDIQTNGNEIKAVSPQIKIEENQHESAHYEKQDVINAMSKTLKTVPDLFPKQKVQKIFDSMNRDSKDIDMDSVWDIVDQIQSKLKSKVFLLPTRDVKTAANIHRYLDLFNKMEKRLRIKRCSVRNGKVRNGLDGGDVVKKEENRSECKLLLKYEI